MLPTKLGAGVDYGDFAKRCKIFVTNTELFLFILDEIMCRMHPKQFNATDTSAQLQLKSFLERSILVTFRDHQADSVH